ncbi:hypothetical protein RO3G_09699 [Lichtheimia corymbifera JMRC:FSU:9682]|uniref:ubiquitinyl hydrolase 1 n=1 Tax=Lichtheimia corymbifera JMRC:FSU:9682 TaxID=1263082 RepID=A0A068S8K6_9FUNG|nr:hypothetical protein RO3G_09699 [Lichtheimia corymbifera JMRC:FSU:9682]
MSSSSHYHFPAVAAIASIAIASLALTTTSYSTTINKKSLRMSKGHSYGKITRLDGHCSASLRSIIKALATLVSFQSYLTYQQQKTNVPSLIDSLCTAIQSLYDPEIRRRRPKPVVDLIGALEHQQVINQDDTNRDVCKLFDAISKAITLGQETQYWEEPYSLLDAIEADLDTLDTASVSSIESVFSVSSCGSHPRPRRHGPRNPFIGLTGTKFTCIQCGYTSPIQHDAFHVLSLQASLTTLEECLKDFTAPQRMKGMFCRKCMLSATLEALSSQKLNPDASDEEVNEHAGKIHVLKDAIRYNVEAPLPGIPLVQTTSCIEKQTLFANPPKALCIQLPLSRSHNLIPETLDLAPYTTDNDLTEPRRRLSRPSRIFLRNMAAGHRFVHGPDGLKLALKDDIQLPIQDALPSLSIPGLPVRSVVYRLRSVIIQDAQGRCITSIGKPTSTPSRFRFTSQLKKARTDNISNLNHNEASMLFYERDE